MLTYVDLLTSVLELARAGVSDDMARPSIGIEHVDDLLSDLEQALRASQIRAAA